MESIGEEIDTKSSIHGSKKLNFYLPDPKQAGKSRKADKAFEDSLMQSNTLYLIDFDSATGTIYFGKTNNFDKRLLNKSYSSEFNLLYIFAKSFFKI